MELITFGKELLQSAVEHGASYKMGQMVLRQLDKVLWVVEKAARWAVPPPLDQDERPQPELVRPLPWVIFLMLLMMLRATRESVSLVNLVMGKPPLRSIDVVMYIQGKRRYLRTLKYQGNRLMRVRNSGSQHRQSWYSSIQTLFEFTMCFRRHPANNNSHAVSDNEQIFVVKRSKRERDQSRSPVPGGSEDTMERLIEKMMVDLNADSDDDSSYTLTNATSLKSDSDTESYKDIVFTNDVSISTPNKHAISTPEELTPERAVADTKLENNDQVAETKSDVANTRSEEKETPKEKRSESPTKLKVNHEGHNATYDLPKVEDKNKSPKEASQKFIQEEKSKQSPKKKIANGRVSDSPKNKGPMSKKRESSGKGSVAGNNGSSTTGRDATDH